MRKITFIISEIQAGEPARILGRCGDLPIRVGDSFSMACRYAPRNSIDDFAVPSLLDTSHSISLTVMAIDAYNQHLEELGPGMSGELSVSGADVNGLGEGTILEGITRTTVSV